MFKYPAWNYNRFLEMPEYCEHCGLRFEREPGFFWGAMYINYAFVVAIFITVWVAFGFVLFPGVDLEWYVHLSVILPLVILLMPFSIRLSRSIMLNLFAQVEFKPEYVDNPPTGNPEEDPDNVRT
jgi:uncharacterized protein (DUF983 family)